MNSEEIRERFLNFFEARGHKIVRSSSLVPEGDSSVLFTTAGMQQFKPYYLGKKLPMSDIGSLNATSIQKCIRTSDIDEVGDERHLTFFEMLGNFSFGGYWKKEAIQYAYDFVTKEMNLKIDYVTVFQGEEGVPSDTESEEIWKSIDPNMTIKKFGREDNFWGPTGEEGPCGPTTEIYVDSIEIWNVVFNEFYQNKNKSLRPLDVRGIDTGMGLERLAKVSQKVPTVFDTDLFSEVLTKIAEIGRTRITNKLAERVIADHIRTSVFIIADGITPSNTERGYTLRRLLRRAIRFADSIFINKENFLEIAKVIQIKYKDFYPEILNFNILKIIKEESDKFSKTLKNGLKEFEKGVDPFILFTTYGFPYELTAELAKEKGIKIDHEKFKQALERHQETSRAGVEQKFKGGLAGHSEAEVKYHTATHLLHQALRDVLGDSVKQKGSNITPERLRFDFSYPQRMTEEERRKVENIVNQKIGEALPVNKKTMPREEAEKIGALHFFGDKYGEEIDIYFIGESLATAYSKEFCGGPHVSNTSELGIFKIIKEEAISAGVRRVKAVLK